MMGSHIQFTSQKQVVELNLKVIFKLGAFDVFQHFAVIVAQTCRKLCWHNDRQQPIRSGSMENPHLPEQRATLGSREEGELSSWICDMTQH